MKLNNEHFRKISDDISELYALHHVYNSFMQHFYTSEYQKSIPNKEINILVFLRNSILHSFFVIFRRVLSTGRGEASLANYYKKTHQLMIDPDDNYDESILKSCLSNHYEQWQLLKKYINKNIFHLDESKKDHLNPDISISDLKLLLDDLELTYNRVASKIGVPEGSLEPDNAKDLADRLFTRWAAKY